MPEVRIRPRSSIVDPELARAATVDLPVAFTGPRPQTPKALVEAIAAFRRPAEPERTIVMTLAPVAARLRR
jgi:hypothetical protein